MGRLPKNYGPFKNLMIELYQDNTVEDVARIMEQSHGFTASHRWYMMRFSEWNCYKYESRRRNLRPEGSKVAKAPSSSKAAIHFTDECPYSPECPSAPFPTAEDYAKHKESHHARVLKAFSWEAAQTRVGLSLAVYLAQMTKDSVDRSHFTFKDLFDQPQDTYDPLDVLDCAEVLLHYSSDEHESICTIKAVIAREVTFPEAKPTLERLVSIAGEILGSEVAHYPPVIEWVFDVIMACGPDDAAPEWSFFQSRLARIQENINLPSCLKEYVGTFILQKFIDRTKSWPQKVPSLELVVEACREFNIPLDVGYISIIQDLNQEQASACATVAGDDHRTPAFRGTPQGDPSPAYLNTHELADFRSPTPARPTPSGFTPSVSTPSSSGLIYPYSNLTGRTPITQSDYGQTVLSPQIVAAFSTPLRPESRHGNEHQITSEGLNSLAEHPISMIVPSEQSKEALTVSQIQDKSAIATVTALVDTQRPDEGMHAVRAQRASRPKVKTGCGNCRVRRVKCDETRPQCIRCVKSLRFCTGYPGYKQSINLTIPIAPRPPHLDDSSSSSSSSSHTTPAPDQRFHYVQPDPFSDGNYPSNFRRPAYQGFTGGVALKRFAWQSHLKKHEGTHSEMMKKQKLVSYVDLTADA